MTAHRDPIVIWLDHYLEGERYSWRRVEARAGVAEGVIRRWMSGAHAPNLFLLRHVVQALGYDIVLKKRRSLTPTEAKSLVSRRRDLSARRAPVSGARPGNTPVSGAVCPPLPVDSP